MPGELLTRVTLLQPLSITSVLSRWHRWALSNLHVAAILPVVMLILP
jgi:hypothetical protein